MCQCRFCRCVIFSSGCWTTRSLMLARKLLTVPRIAWLKTTCWYVRLWSPVCHAYLNVSVPQCLKRLFLEVLSSSVFSTGRSVLVVAARSTSFLVPLLGFSTSFVFWPLTAWFSASCVPEPGAELFTSSAVERRSIRPLTGGSNRWAYVCYRVMG